MTVKVIMFRVERLGYTKIGLTPEDEMDEMGEMRGAEK